MTGVFKPGEAVQLYVNGQLAAEDVTNVPANIGLSGKFKIGARADNTTQGHWNGQIDDLRITGRALSASEIQSLSSRPVTAVTRRSTYSIAGQAVAVRVTGDPVAANNGLFYIHSDHLGSTNVLTKYSDGYIVSSSLTRYTPFGSYRSGGRNQITDRAYTGQKENMALGLYYYNARYYAPYLNRFLSADTLVPDPQNPQSFNRYSYVYNNVLNLTDPSGHCPHETVCIISGGDTLPTWWINNTRRIYVEGYGVFDRGHIERGYRSAEFFMEETEQALARGGGAFDNPAISRGGFLRSDYEATYSISDKVTSDQMEGVLYGMYTDFERGYEEHQSGRLDFYSSYAPEDLPSDHLGFWAFLNGKELDEIPFILENLGKVTPWNSGSMLINTWTNSKLNLTVPTGIPRNHEFTPMAPQTTDLGKGSSKTVWQNRPWPSWLEITPIPSSPDTWQRVN